MSKFRISPLPKYHSNMFVSIRDNVMPLGIRKDMGGSKTYEIIDGRFDRQQNCWMYLVRQEDAPIECSDYVREDDMLKIEN